VELKAAHQGFYAHAHLGVGVAGQVGVARGGQNAVVAQNLLYFQQVNAGFDQVGCIAVAQAVGGDLFFRPQASATW
jgi:hypothetical protein